MQVMVGDPIPLNLKLYDNSPIETISAHLFSNLGDKLAQVKLYHLESGLYVNTDTPMPDVKSLIVIYKVESSDKYEDSSEVFFSIPRPKDEPKFIHGFVESREKINDFISGVIYEIANN